ncbi:MAG: hypothetical protein H7242_07330 [Microbacteriaceae bacterium]|nr:hypothetical protein [Burkholderiaceae bacterium]
MAPLLLLGAPHNVFQPEQIAVIVCMLAAKLGWCGQQALECRFHGMPRSATRLIFSRRAFRASMSSRVAMRFAPAASAHATSSSSPAWP